MAADGSIIIDTKVDESGLKNGLASLSKTSTAHLALIGTALAGVGVAMVSVGTRALKLASDLTEVQNVVDTTFGKNADKINTWADNAIEAFGMSELQAKKFNGTMGAMIKSMGLTDDQVLDMSTALTGLAGDFASFYNLDHQDAFDKIRSGISGETEPLKQLGVNMSVANLEAYALSQGIKTAYSAMSEAEKATLRYNYLLSVTKDAQGDFAKTSDSLANQTRMAQERFNALSADIAKELLPVATDLLKWANDTLKAFNSLSSDQKKYILVALGLATALGPVMTTAMTVSKAISAVSIANQAATVSTEALTAAQMTTPWGLIAAAIGFAAIGIGTYISSQETATVATEDHSDELSKLAARYEELNNASQKTVGEAEELKSVEEQLIGILGDKAEVLKDLKSGTDEYAEALRGATKAALEGQSALLRTQELEAKQKVSKAGQGGVFSFERKEYIANEGAYDQMLSPISTKYKGGSTDTSIFSIPKDADETVKFYGELKQALANLDAEYSKLAESGNQAAADALLNSAAYNNVKGAIDTLTPSVGEYINIKIKEKLVEEQLKNGIPKTTAEYEKMKQSVMDSMGVLSSFSSAAEGAGNASSGAGAEANAFTDALKSLSDNMDVVTSAQEELKNTGTLSMGTIQGLIGKYSDLEDEMQLYLSGVISDQEMQDILAQKYQASAESYKNAMWTKMESSEEYYNRAVLSNSDLVQKWADDYGIDAENFESVADLKASINEILNNSVAAITNDSVDELANKYGVDLDNFTTVEEKKLAVAKAMVKAMVKAYGIMQGATAGMIQSRLNELYSENVDVKNEKEIAELEAWLATVGADVNGILAQIDDIKANYTPKSSDSKSSSDNKKTGEKSPEQVARDEEAKRKAKVDAYEAGVDEIERIDLREQERKKAYGQINADQEAQIIADRAKRYRGYAAEVLTMEGLTDEERARLYKEYTEKAEDYELDLYLFVKNEQDKAVDEQKKNLDEAKKIIKDTYAEIATAAKEELDKIAQAQENLANKLKSYGQAFKETVITIKGAGQGMVLKNGSWEDKKDLTITKITVGDVKQDIKDLEDYNTALTAVKDRGGSAELFAQLRDMSVEDATKYANALLALSDADFKEYVDGLAFKNQYSEDIASKFFEDDITESKNKAAKRAKEAFDELTDQFKDHGKDYANAIAEGFNEAFGAAADKMKATVSTETAGIGAGIVGGTTNDQNAADANTPSDATTDTTDQTPTVVQNSFVISSSQATPVEQAAVWTNTMRVAKLRGDFK